MKFRVAAAAVPSAYPRTKVMFIALVNTPLYSINSGDLSAEAVTNPELFIVTVRIPNACQFPSESFMATPPMPSPNIFACNTLSVTCTPVVFK